MDNQSDVVESGPVRVRKSRDTGLDLLRVAAMAIVAAQHGLTVIGHYDWTMVTASGVTIGQFGVAIFCAVSGWFALGDGAPPGRWLAARLAKLYPAYWIATVFAFCLALAMARPVTLGLFVSQMAGTGFFTHGWDLVNVASWFISLILLCYVLAALARLSGRPAFLMIGFCLAAVLLVAFQVEVSLSRHVIAFAAAAIARLHRRPAMLLGFAIVLAPLLAIQPSFIYAIVALPALWLSRERTFIKIGFVTSWAGYTYEFFLLHGIFLAGAAKLIRSAPLAIVIGIGCSLPAAMALRRAAAVVPVMATLAYAGVLRRRRGSFVRKRG